MHTQISYKIKVNYLKRHFYNILQHIIYNYTCYDISNNAMQNISVNKLFCIVMQDDVLKNITVVDYFSKTNARFIHIFFFSQGHLI